MTMKVSEGSCRSRAGAGRARQPLSSCCRQTGLFAADVPATDLQVQFLGGPHGLIYGIE
jgi:hypothetical protein